MQQHKKESNTSIGAPFRHKMVAKARQYWGFCQELLFFSLYRKFTETPFSPLFTLHCCINTPCRNPIPVCMPTNAPHKINSNRSLRSRLVVLKLLIAQVTSLLIVPMHALAHSRAASSSDESSVASTWAISSIRLSPLFGHEQGLGCDGWSAAFALDSHPGHWQLDLVVALPRAPGISIPPWTAPHAAPFRPFLARAPPRI